MQAPSLAVRFVGNFNGKTELSQVIRAPTSGPPLQTVTLPAIGRIRVSNFDLGNTWGVMVHVRAEGTAKIGIALNGGSTVGNELVAGPSWQGPIVALLSDTLVLQGGAKAVELLVSPLNAPQWTKIVEGQLAFQTFSSPASAALYTTGQANCPNGVETVVALATVPPGSWIAVCSANAAALAPDPGCTWGFRMTDNSGVPYFTAAIQPAAPVPLPGMALTALALLFLALPTVIELRATVSGGTGDLRGGFFILPASPL